jgi:ATP-binding cassette, subfamily B, bacterial
MIRKASIWQLFRPYRPLLFLLVALTLLSNGAELMVPRIMAASIDAWSAGHFSWGACITGFSVAILLILVFTYSRGLVQTYASEKVAKHTREKLVNSIATQSNDFVENTTPVHLLQHISGDVDAIKNFVAYTVVTVTSSLAVISGAVILMFKINWQLTLYILAVIPLTGALFMMIMNRARQWYRKRKTAFDRLNTIIHENILGATLIRTVHAQQLEYEKYAAANQDIRNIGFSILRLFALLIPLIRFSGNVAGLSLLLIGGHMVIAGQLSLGDFAAFNSYVGMIILPIFALGMMGNVTAQASVCYERIARIPDLSQQPVKNPKVTEPFREIELENVTVIYDRKPAIRNISLSIQANSKVAIVGPTTAGKTQLLYLIAGFIKPAEGQLKYNGNNIKDPEPGMFGNRIGIVFQDSFIFNTTLRENISFNDSITEEQLMNAIETAELKEYFHSLPDKLETVISERGASLSGGQKQRIMLARALAANPSLLLLDDFVSRLDVQTARNILQNIQQNYPHMTVVAVSQKADPVMNYDKIVLLNNGELVACGRHDWLMKTSYEYAKLCELQKSTSNYEV